MSPRKLSRLLRSGATAAAIAAVALAGAATFADRVVGVAPALLQPPVVRGGVLLVPLEAEKPGDGWPQALDVELTDGRLLAADVIWIGPRDAPWRRHWTDDPSGLRWRPIAPTDDTSRASDGGNPFMVVQLPSGADGTLVVRDPRPADLGNPSGGPQRTVTVRPSWVDPAPEVDGGLPRLELIRADDRPDPDSPFDHWRWTLLAQRLEMAPPAPPADPIGRLVALHAADLWRSGLARLAAQSPGVAAECLEMLTNVVTTPDGRAVAAWVTDPVETATLLGVLLDRQKDERLMMETALAWAESRRPLTIWTVAESVDAVVLAVANARVEPQTVTLDWLASRGVATEPLEFELLGQRLHHVTLPRPKVPVAEPTVSRDWLHTPMLATVAHLGNVSRIQVSPAMLRVTPPGASLGTLWPPLRLADVRAGLQEPLPANRRTAAILRRVSRRWEIFIECGRPTEMPEVGGSVEAWPPRGVEAVTVVIGERDSPIAVLCVPEVGAWWTPVGVAAGLQVHRVSQPGLWRCRIVLPPEWMPTSPLAAFRVGLARTHGDHDGMETSGLPRAAWIDRPSPLSFDLSRWEEQ